MSESPWKVSELRSHRATHSPLHPFKHDAVACTPSPDLGRSLLRRQAPRMLAVMCERFSARFCTHLAGSPGFSPGIAQARDPAQARGRQAVSLPVSFGASVERSHTIR